MDRTSILDRFYPPPRTDALDAAFTRHARPGQVVLDAGCGGARGCARTDALEPLYIVGMDMGEDVGRNPFCDAAVVADVASVPFRSNTFDLIHCRWVLEHVLDAQAVFREFARVLKPGGRLLAITPNLYHYATIMSRLTPMAFHRWWHRDQYDPFPTYYQANTRRRIRHLATQAGMRMERMELIEGPPHYFIRNPLLFRVGVLVERVLNASEKLGVFRQRILLEGVKVDGDE